MIPEVRVGVTQVPLYTTNLSDYQVNLAIMYNTLRSHCHNSVRCYQSDPSRSTVDGTCIYPACIIIIERKLICSTWLHIDVSHTVRLTRHVDCIICFDFCMTKFSLFSQIFSHLLKI